MLCPDKTCVRAGYKSRSGLQKARYSTIESEIDEVMRHVGHISGDSNRDLYFEAFVQGSQEGLSTLESRLAKAEAGITQAFVDILHANGVSDQR